LLIILEARFANLYGLRKSTIAKFIAVIWVSLAVLGVAVIALGGNVLLSHGADRDAELSCPSSNDLRHIGQI
jgi:hypothetical protein